MTGSDVMTRQQKRAKDAADQVESLIRSAERGVKDPVVRRYNTLAHSLPVWLRTNGLLQTVAFLEAKAAVKKSRAERELIDGLTQHLRAAGFEHRAGLLSTALVDLDYADYLRWQEEAVACAGWVKRFSAAHLGEPDRDGDAESSESSAVGE